MNLLIETEIERDGRWIGVVPSMPGVATYGRNPADAIHKVQELALRVIADRLENGETAPNPNSVVFLTT